MVDAAVQRKFITSSSLYEVYMKFWNLWEREQAGDFFGPDLAADERTWARIFSG